MLVLRWRQVGRLFVIAALAITALHGVLEGVRWQMAPAYLAVVLLCFAAWKPYPHKPRLWLLTACTVLLFACAGALFSRLLPVFYLPNPTGPYQVGTAILYLKDPSRLDGAAPGGGPRELKVQVWYPAEPSRVPHAHYRELRETRLLTSYQSLVITNSRLDAPLAQSGTPFPVVLFNHEWHGRRTQNTFLTEELASHGYFVASIDHPYNSALVAMPDGRVLHGNPPGDISSPESSNPQKVRDIWDRELVKWVADQRLVLDELAKRSATAGNAWYGRLNTQLTASVGHSFGGAASTALCAEDARVRGAVNMDGWFFSAIRSRGAGQPLLIFNTFEPGAKLSSNPGVEERLDIADLADVHDSLSKYGGYRVEVTGAKHQDFTDQPLVSPMRKIAQSGTVGAAQMQTIVRTYVLAFLDKILLGKESPVLNEDSRPFGEASLEVWPQTREEAVVAKYHESSRPTTREP